MERFVATANSLDVWLSGKESCSTPSHRIGVVDNPSIGANIHDVIGKVGQNRDCSNGFGTGKYVLSDFLVLFHGRIVDVM